MAKQLELRWKIMLVKIINTNDRHLMKTKRLHQPKHYEYNNQDNDNRSVSGINQD